MILPLFILPERANQQWTYSGIDSPEECFDLKHFNSFAWPVSYNYNSRGFRDDNWPDNIDELNSAIWCFGDSFTVGLGSPIEHTWWYFLSQKLSIKCFNVSLDGASNEWIARKVQELVKEVKPRAIVIHWSYTHRREASVESILQPMWESSYQNVADSTWPPFPLLAEFNSLPETIKHEILEVYKLDQHIPGVHLLDELRRLNSIKSTADEDTGNLINCIQQVEQVSAGIPVVHSFITNFAPTDQYKNIKDQLTVDYVPFFGQVDFARDGHHYGLLTSQYFSDQLVDLLRPRL